MDKEKLSERPELDWYKDEIHHPNGSTEDRWRHNEYVEDLNRFIDQQGNQIEKLKAILRKTNIDVWKSGSGEWTAGTGVEWTPTEGEIKLIKELKP